MPCHNDLLAANFIAGEPASGTEGQLWIVDWEYAGMGDRYFDLANFAVNNELGEAAEEALLGDYFGELATPRRARRAAADALHVRLPRGDVGRACRAAVSELDFDFAGYAQHALRPARARRRPTRASQRWLERGP